MWLVSLGLSGDGALDLTRPPGARHLLSRPRTTAGSDCRASCNNLVLGQRNGLHVKSVSVHSIEINTNYFQNQLKGTFRYSKFWNWHIWLAFYYIKNKSDHNRKILNIYMYICDWLVSYDFEINPSAIIKYSTNYFIFSFYWIYLITN